VVGRWTTGRREATGVASAALIGNRCLCVIPLGWLPAHGVVTTHTISAGGHVRTRFTGG
jgi:hypothetical protein